MTTREIVDAQFAAAYASMPTVSLDKPTDSRPSHCDGNRSTVDLSSSVAWGLRRNDLGNLQAVLQSARLRINPEPFMYVSADFREWAGISA